MSEQWHDCPFFHWWWPRPQCNDLLSDILMHFLCYLFLFLIRQIIIELLNQRTAGIVVLVALYFWENKKEEKQITQISRNETLSRLPVRLSTNRIVELVQLRDINRPVSIIFFVSLIASSQLLSLNVYFTSFLFSHLFLKLLFYELLFEPLFLGYTGRFKSICYSSNAKSWEVSDRTAQTRRSCNSGDLWGFSENPNKTKRLWQHKTCCISSFSWG
jgi:hypothetical protein